MPHYCELWHLVETGIRNKPVGGVHACWLRFILVIILVLYLLVVITDTRLTLGMLQIAVSTVGPRPVY